MKKILVIVLALIMTISLFACGKNSEVESQSDTPVEEDKAEVPNSEQQEEQPVIEESHISSPTDTDTDPDPKPNKCIYYVPNTDDYSRGVKKAAEERGYTTVDCFDLYQAKMKSEWVHTQDQPVEEVDLIGQIEGPIFIKESVYDLQDRESFYSAMADKGVVTVEFIDYGDWERLADITVIPNQDIEPYAKELARFIKDNYSKSTRILVTCINTVPPFEEKEYVGLLRKYLASYGYDNIEFFLGGIEEYPKILDVVNTFEPQLIFLDHPWYGHAEYIPTLEIDYIFNNPVMEFTSDNQKLYHTRLSYYQHGYMAANAAIDAFESKTCDSVVELPAWFVETEDQLKSYWGLE